MIKRIGLVIHLLGWAGTLAGIIYGLINWRTFYTGCDFRDPTVAPRTCGYFINEEEIYLAIGIALVSFFAGWAINFIMSGHKSPLPWSKENKS